MKVLVILAALLVAVAAQECNDNQFTCKNGNCIPAAYQCDGDNDCNDLSDELGCPCEDDDFVCENTVCIPGSYYCDQWADCEDGSDEIDCPCPNGEVKCDNGQCIKEIYWCDGVVEDCNDRSDESNCNSTSTTTTIRRTLLHPVKPSLRGNKVHEMKVRRSRLMK